jgi:hypothetical protein
MVIRQGAEGVSATLLHPVGHYACNLILPLAILLEKCNCSGPSSTFEICYNTRVATLLR